MLANVAPLIPTLAARPAAPPPVTGGWVEVHPDFCARLDALGLTTASALLDLPGEVVSGHADRHVVRVELPGWDRALFLKRQHCVTWRERRRQSHAGFGLRSRCGREAAILKALAAAGLPAPRWVVHGEDGRGRSFLLVEDLAGYVELRRLLGDTGLSPIDRTRLAARVGRAVAALHMAGFTTPDLSAKHVFVHPASGEVALIDWQSACGGTGGGVAFASLFPQLAALHASLADHLATPRERLRFLGVYRRAAGIRQNRLASYAGAIKEYAVAAMHRRSVRDQRQPVGTGAGQRLVWLAGEAVCAVPEVAAGWPRPAACAPFYGETAGTRRITLPDGRAAELVRGTSFAPLARLRACLRGRPWRSPGATLGRVLFHLDRYRIPAPRLLAFGQRLTGAASAGWFALYEPPAGRPLADWLDSHPSAELRQDVAEQCERLLSELHDAGCRLTGRAFWVDDDDRVSVGGVRHVRIVRRVSPRDRRRDAATLLPGRRG